MGKQNAFELRSVLVIGSILSSIYISTRAQYGFVSIDCGGTPYTDGVTTLVWEDDANYIKTGSTGRVPNKVNSSDENPVPLQTFTYFPERRNKQCYELPTRVNVTFLLRAMFLHGNAPDLSLPISFSVAVNSTVWSKVIYKTADTFETLSRPVVLEGIFFSPGNLTHFCLVPITGTPFISSLELRELDANGTMYSAAGISETQFLNSLVRINCGADLSTPSLRYPDDKYDRLWHTPDASYQSVRTITAENITLPAPNHLNNVPPKVMQSAWLNDSSAGVLSASFNLGGSVSTAYIALYVQQLSFDFGPSYGEEFDIYVNGFYTTTFTAHTYPGMEEYPTWLVGAKVNFSFVEEPDSYYGPVLNAIEVYADVEFNTSATAATDVDALTILQISFNLTSWQGDPCYPVPWDWAICSPDVQARVTALLLSNMSIHSSIPSTISNLDALTEIRLDNNSLYGVIPDSLALLPNLVFLSLKNNNLSGDIPPSLVAKLGSNFQYSGNRLLGSTPGLPPGSTPGVPLGSTSKKESSNIGIIVGVIVGALLALGIVLGILIWFMKICKITSPVDLPVLVPIPPDGRISYESVKIATKSFQTKIGQGSFGPVYSGLLNDREVAVKLNSIQSSQGRKEFIAEVDILTRVHHKNLVSLVGYCDDANGLILVYEFQANGTLHEWIHGKSKSLDWKQRLAIAVDAAKGEVHDEKDTKQMHGRSMNFEFRNSKQLLWLKTFRDAPRIVLNVEIMYSFLVNTDCLQYLHTGCNPTIIHRDVKSSNILLDVNMVAKVADFGLSKSAPCEKSSGFSTGVKGTFGYLDPEYYKMGRLTHKSDVYSYGVVLAELMTGRLPYQSSTNDGSAVILVDWMRKMMERNDIEALADPNLQGQFDADSMWRVADLALSCVDPMTAKRPDFTEVLTELNEAMEVHNRNIFSTHSPLSMPSHYFIPRPGSNPPYLNLT